MEVLVDPLLDLSPELLELLELFEEPDDSDELDPVSEVLTVSLFESDLVSADELGLSLTDFLDEPRESLR